MENFWENMKFDMKKYEKVSSIIKKEFDSKPVYNEKYLKTKAIYLTMEKSTQIFAIIKYQKKALNVFVYQ